MQRTRFILNISKRGVSLETGDDSGDSWDYTAESVSLEMYDAVIAALVSYRNSYKGPRQKEELPEWTEVYQDGGNE